MCLPDEVEEPAEDTGTPTEDEPIEDTAETVDSGDGSGDPDSQDTAGSEDGSGEEPEDWSAGKISYRTSPTISFLAGLIVLAAPVDDPDWPIGTHCALVGPDTDEASGDLVAWGVPMAFICPTPEDEPSLSVAGGRYDMRASLYPSDDTMPMYCASDEITVDGDVVWEFTLEPC